ncbi:hypothetical protein CWI39_1562p0010 [Hamiltosporidium magnivora]|uniref:Uncharacterized protein n=1 Tax=Hamiltosporidium magnivora TaxID=148818 RepID=A0A4Q9L0I3_9MICR|nr:hypothetical protein CWI39_1562p0010 [Hamiltosporidium magnivora]
MSILCEKRIIYNIKVHWKLKKPIISNTTDPTKTQKDIKSCIPPDLPPNLAYRCNKNTVPIKIRDITSTCTGLILNKLGCSSNNFISV